MALGSSFHIQSDEFQSGLPSFEASINAILILGSCLEAKVELGLNTIYAEVRGAFQAVQPLRRGRSNARGSDSTWWPEGFHWVQSAHIADNDDLSSLTQQPVLVATCTCMDSSGPCSSPADAIDFMSQHSRHCQSWAHQLERKQQLQLQLQQEMAQVQQNQSEALALPIQRTASLVCLEAVHLLLRTPGLSHLPVLRQLARAVLDHPVMWHVTSFYRPDPKRKPPALRSPHLLWLVAGAPPYCQSAGMMPPARKHCSLEACALVCCLRSCNLLPQPDGSGYTHQQVAVAIQQLVIQLCDSSAKLNQRSQVQACILHDAFIDDLLLLRGLKLEHIVAAAEAGFSKQLEFCVVCGDASSQRHRDPLVSCKSCCHSYHVSCALVDGTAEALYSMPAYPAARAGTCLGCQHFPFRATSAAGGLPWALAAGKEDEEEAADPRERAAPRRAGRPTPPPAAAPQHPAALRPAPHGGKVSRGPTPPAAAVLPRPTGPVMTPALLAALPAGLTSAQLAAITDGSGCAASRGLPQSGAERYVSSGHQSEYDPSNRSESGSEGRAVRDEAAASDMQGELAEDAAWDAAARVTASFNEPSLAANGGTGSKAKAKKKATAIVGTWAAGSLAGGQPAAGLIGIQCQPVPGGPPPPSADAKAVKQHVLDQLEQRSIPLSTLTCRTLLRHGLLPLGLHVDFISKGRFMVVAAEKGGTSQKEQMLRCTVPGCCCVFSTWQAAELHARPGASSRRHSTEEMHMTGTGVSIKGLLKMVQSGRSKGVQPEFREQRCMQSPADFEQYESDYQQYTQHYEQYQRLHQGYEQQHYHSTAAADADEDDAAHALQLLSAATRQQRSPLFPPVRVREPGAAAAAAYEDLAEAEGQRLPPDFAARGPPRAVGRKRWLEAHDPPNDNSSDVSVTSTATAAERAGAEANKHKRLRTGLQQMQQQHLLAKPSERDQLLLHDQKACLQMLQPMQLTNLERSQPQHITGQQEQQPPLSVLKPIMLGVRVVRAEPAIKPILVAVMQSGDVELLQQQLDFWAPETQFSNKLDEETGAASAEAAAPSARGWDYGALTRQGIPRLVSDVCTKSMHAGPQQTVVMQLCMDTVAAAYAMQQPEGDLHGKNRQLTEVMLQLARASLSCSSPSHLNVSTAMLAAAAAAVTVPGSAQQRLDQLLSICGSLRVLTGSLGELLWSGLWELVRTRVVRDGVIVEYGLSALQQLLLLVCAAPAAWQVALLIPHISMFQQQQHLHQGAGGVRSSNLLQALFAALFRSFQLKQQCAVHEAELQAQRERQPNTDQVLSEAAAERMRAKTLLLPAFAGAMAAATAWLASSSSNMQLCAAHDLLAKQVVMMQQMLRALLLKDQQLHNVLAFVSCGFADTLLDSAVNSLGRARQVFELAAGRDGEAAAKAAVSCRKNLASGTVVCECEPHAAAFDCKLLGELLETTIAHIARPASS